MRRNVFFFLRQRYKELEAENSRLKKLVADVSLDKEILKEAASKNF